MSKEKELGKEPLTAECEVFVTDFGTARGGGYTLKIHIGAEWRPMAVKVMAMTEMKAMLKLVCPEIQVDVFEKSLDSEKTQG